MRVALLACSAKKLGYPAPAKDLYQGNLFKLSRAWVERRSSIDAWGILSAKHGLVLPEQRLEPYNVALSQLTREELEAWRSKVTQEIVNRWGAGTIYKVLAGADYAVALKHRLPYVEEPFRHWLDWRRDVEKKRGRVGIGWLMQQLKENRHG